ncbi:L,D-transpeptidase family protein [Rubellimicrobium aerolatum]|uniref:L,D-transpeptidase family protein n=1 Tax=Rubellimicrobium aerolatum TaxID=490979 RepID=A0ABW0SBZ3_9RHOB|nr:L,D-transpeptidase [Rubellimicrobium aerolatum]MBP1805985.1 lipoprotein-anchoring transpeptidase ErfK/SrfK [Rubellimicrobium aerolatum]
MPSLRITLLGLAVVAAPASAQNLLASEAALPAPLAQQPFVTPPPPPMSPPILPPVATVVRPSAPGGLAPEAIEAATYEGGDLPSDRSALTVKVQVLLDRAGISPGVIDGRRGGMSESAIRAFEEREGLPVDGIFDFAVWAALDGPFAGPVTRAYTVAPQDLANLAPGLPSDYAELAALPWLGYQRVTEMLAERFHMDEDFLLDLNPGATFQPGETITVADPGEFQAGEVTRIEVRKGESRLAAYDATGRMVANYPVTVGSTDTPSPEGVVEVTAIAHLPTYHYSPDNFVQGENLQPLTLPPGPNGPVGSVWIDLSRPSYGLHGTPEPSTLFRRNSHGCVRLSNWDAEELASLVRVGATVTFLD